MKIFENGGVTIKGVYLILTVVVVSTMILGVVLSNKKSPSNKEQITTRP
ncbi:MAG: hypothetical protein WC827_01435 [Candidatus Paceibacterota bacterium]|jgi:hypothetical protein